MSDAVLVALIALGASGSAALWAWLRQRRKTAVDVEAVTASILAERFEDATELSKFVAAEVEKVVGPIRQELRDLKKDSHKMRDSIRAYFTRLWLWDHRGRKGDLPLPDSDFLNSLGLGSLLNDPLEDTQQTLENIKENNQ